MLQTQREFDGSLVIAVPKKFVEENGLVEGSRVDMHFEGNKMTVEVVTRPQ